MAIELKAFWQYESGVVVTEIDVNAGDIEENDVIVACLTKDDDVATTYGPAGFKLQQGWESDNNIYSEIWTKKADAANTKRLKLGHDGFGAQGTAILTDDFSEIYDIRWTNGGLTCFVLGLSGTAATVKGYSVSGVYAYEFGDPSRSLDGSMTSSNLSQRSIDISSDGTKIYYLGSNVSDKIYSKTMSTAYDISTAGTETDGGAIGTDPTALAFKSDGTEVTIAGTFDSVTKLRTYSLATAWDITSNRTTLNTSGSLGTTTIYGLRWNDDGTQLIICKDGTTTINCVLLSTAWDVSTVTGYSDYEFDCSEEVTGNAVGMDYAGNEGHFWACDDGSGTLQRYVRTSYFGDVTHSSTYDWFDSAGTETTEDLFVSGDIPEYDGTNASAIMKPDGTKLYTKDGNVIKEYVLTIPFDMRSVSTSTSYNVNTEDGLTTLNVEEHMDISPDGTKIFVGDFVALNEYDLRCYDLSTAWDLSTASLNSTNLKRMTSFTRWRFKPDGTALILMDNSSFYERAMTTAWDLTTLASVVGSSITSDANGDTPFFCFGDSGNKLLTGGTKIYDLSTAYDITTATLNNTITHDSTHLSISSWSTTNVIYLQDGIVLSGGNGWFRTVPHSVSYSWTGDSEEYVVGITVINGADLDSIQVQTALNAATSTPQLPAITPANDDSIVIRGFGVDGDSTPHNYLNGDTTETRILEEAQSTGGAGSAGMSIGYLIQSGTATTVSARNASIASADETTQWSIAFGPAANEGPVTGSVTETVSLTDSVTNTATLNETRTESVTLDATEDANGVFVVDQTDAVTLAETNDSYKSIEVSETESVTLDATETATITLGASITESAVLDASESATLNTTADQTEAVNLDASESATEITSADQAEAVALTDSQAGANVTAAALTESVNLTELITGDVDSEIAGTVVESVTLDASESATAVLNDSVTEAASATETSQATNVTAADITESVSLDATETPALLLPVDRTESVSLDATETATIDQGVTEASITETVSATETSLAALLLPVDITETVTATESNSAQNNAAGDVTESVSLDDTPGATYITDASLTEAVSLSELTDGFTGLDDSVTETITLGSAESAVSILGDSVSESVALSETNNGVKTVADSQSDAVNLSDTATLTATLNETITESVSLSETITGDTLGDFQGSITEPVSLDATETATAELIGQANEAVNLDATETNTAVLNVSVNESVNLDSTESSGNIVDANLVESISLTEISNRARLTAAATIESANLGDSTSAINNAAADIDESVTLGDQVIGSANYECAISEAISVSEIQAGNVVSTYDETITESITLSESSTVFLGVIEVPISRQLFVGPDDRVIMVPWQDRNINI